MTDDFLSMAHMRAGLEEAIRERDEALAERDAADTALNRAIRERDRLRALLREVEWGAENDIGTYCPSCRGYQHNSHAPDCRLAAALEGR